MAIYRFVKIVPPFDIKGKGTPVKGAIPIEEAMFSIVWKKKIAIIPTANNFPNSSVVYLAIYIPLIIINIKSKRRSVDPIKPVSSAKTGKIESEICSGR